MTAPITKNFKSVAEFKILPHDVGMHGRKRLSVDCAEGSRSPNGVGPFKPFGSTHAAVPLAPGRGLTMPTHTEISSHFAQSRGRGPLFTTVVVCFDDASEVMQVRVGIADSGDSDENRAEAIRAARRLALRFATEDGAAAERH